MSPVLFWPVAHPKLLGTCDRMALAFLCSDLNLFSRLELRLLRGHCLRACTLGHMDHSAQSGDHECGRQQFDQNGLVGLKTFHVMLPVYYSNVPRI